VAHAGIENPWKGGKYVINCIRSLNKNKEIVLLNIGSDKEILELDRDEYVSVPYVDNPEKLAYYYSAADLFLFPSLAESFGLVIIEAMACGLPVVCFNTGPLKEIVRHKETGYIANYKDEKELINYVKLILSHPKKAQSFGKKAVIRAKKYFDFNIQTKKYLNIYKELIL